MNSNEGLNMLMLGKRIGTGTVASFAGALFIVLAATSARAQTPVHFGDTITDPGVYYLHGNQSGVGDGIIVDSDDVVLLLSRFTLRGNGTGRGIFVDGRQRVTIHGGRVTRFDRGIEFYGGLDGTLKDTRIDHCTSNGLVLYGSTRTNVLRVRCEYHGANGIDVFSGAEHRFISVLSNDNDGDGMHFDATGPIGTRDDRIRKCWLGYNGGHGIHMLNAGLNELKENQFVANERAGLLLEGMGTGTLLGSDGSDDNVITQNWCVFNEEGGIVLELGSDYNDLSHNTALANQPADVVDENPEPPCANTWFLNTFIVRDGDGEDCIF